MKDFVKNVYKTFKIERFPLPSEKVVADWESRIQADLPKEYRNFILNYNGGFFSDPGPEILVPDENYPSGDLLTTMYGIGTSNAAELGRNIDIFDDNDPLQVLPIGYTRMGSLIIMLIGEEEDGNVMLKLPNSDKYFVAGDSIRDFFSLLRKK